MHYWRFLIGVLAVIETVASFSGHKLIDVHHQCHGRRERDSALTRAPLPQFDRVTTRAEGLGFIRKVHEREDFRRQGTERARDSSDYRSNSVSLSRSSRAELLTRRLIESRSSHEDRRLTGHDISKSTATTPYFPRNTRSIDRIRSEPSIRQFEATSEARRNTDHISERSARTRSSIQNTRQTVRDLNRAFQQNLFLNDRRLTRDRSNEQPTRTGLRNIAGERGFVSTLALSTSNERRLLRDQTYERSSRIDSTSRGTRYTSRQFSETIRNRPEQPRSRSIDAVNTIIKNTRNVRANNEEGSLTTRLVRSRSTRDMTHSNTRGGDNLKNIVHDRADNKGNMQTRVITERIYQSRPVATSRRRQNNVSSDKRERRQTEPETTSRIRDEIYVVNTARRSLSADHRPQPTESRMGSYLERDNVRYGIRENGRQTSRTNIQDQRRREAHRRNSLDGNKLNTRFNFRNNVERSVERKQTERRETLQRNEARNELRHIDSQIRSHRSPLRRTESLRNTLNRILGSDHRDELLSDNNFRYRSENSNQREEYSKSEARRTIQALSRPSKLVVDDNESHYISWKTLIVTALQGIYLSAIIFHISSGSSLKGSKNKMPAWLTFQPTSGIKAD